MRVRWELMWELMGSRFRGVHSSRRRQPALQSP